MVASEEMKDINNVHKYHNKVITFEEFEKSTLNRSQFLDKVETEKIDDKISDDSDNNIMFMPGSIAEVNMPPLDNLRTKWCYHLILFGVLPDGRSATVVVKGIDPYTWVHIPNKYQFSTDKRQKFREKIMMLMSGNKIRYIAVETEMKTEFMGYDRRAYYLKVIFTNAGSWNSHRNKALRLFYKSGYKTATNDATGYYKIVMRDLGLTISSWLNLKNYNTYDTKYMYDEFDKKQKKRQKPGEDPFCILKFADAEVFEVDIDNISITSTDIVRNTPILMKDKSLIMGWDIETLTATGDIPVPKNPDDKIFMICCTFQWHYETGQNQILRICFVDQALNAHPDFLSVVCKDEKDIIKAWSLIIKKMTPEYITGFNDTGYDWPWVVQRAYQHDILEYMAQNMDRMIPRDNTHYMRKSKFKTWDINARKQKDYKRLTTDKLKNVYNHYLSYVIGNYKQEKTKLSASDMMSGYFLQYNGYIAFDVRTVFMQLYPTAEKTSLNYFLKVNNIQSKEDMPYQTMFKIYWHSEHKKSGIAIPDIFRDYATSKTLEADMTDVAKYCIVDAQRCCELTRKRNVIPDKREMANLSFTSTYDGFYRAGGVKIRNIVIAEGQKRGIIFSNTSQKKKDENKYPGAMVLNPNTGLYAPKLTIKERIDKSTQFMTDKGDSFKEEPYSLREIPYQSLMQISDLLTKSKCLEDSIIEMNSPAAGLSAKEAAEVVGHAEQLYISSENEQRKVLCEAEILERSRENKFNLKDIEVFTKYLMEKTRRPVTGLDYASLYPHIIMTYNLSPEYMICMGTCNNSVEVMRTEIKRAKKKGNTLHKIKFQYGTCTVRGFSVRHDNKIDIEHGNAESNKFGIYPTVLKKLYDKRKELKKPKNMYEMLVEHFDDQVNYINKHNKVVDFLNVYDIKKYNDDNGIDWNSIIEQEPAFIICRDKNSDKSEFLNISDIMTWVKKEKLTEFTTDYAVNFIYEKYEGRTSKEKIAETLNFTGDILTHSDMECSFAYFNAKQLALKVMMNTLYGESGNKISPFYILTLAGGITSSGKENLMLASDIVKAEGYTVDYGDTDSIYIEVPDRAFVEIDSAYFGNKMSKLEYCEKQIDITFQEIPKINKQVNDALKIDNGTDFLRMAFEESLYPCVLLSKKKYYGLPHISVPNFNVERKPFIRGLEIKKRGTSEILKKVYGSQIMTKSLDINNLENLAELVYNAVEYFYEGNWQIEDFVKTAVFKPIALEDILAGKGNKSVLVFVDRMNKRGMQVKPYERFKYIIAKKYPNEYDYRGRKSILKVGDRMEFLDYARTNHVEIDHGYYMHGNIITQLARVLIYHDKFYTEPTDDSDAEIKKATEDMVKKCKCHLTIFIKNKKYTESYRNIGPFKQKIFRKADEIIKANLITTNGISNNSNMFMDWKMDFNKSFTALFEKMEKLSLKRASEFGADYIKYIRKQTKRKKEDIIYDLYDLYTGKEFARTGSIFKQKNIGLVKNKFRELFVHVWRMNSHYRDIINIISEKLEKCIESKTSEFYLPVTESGSQKNADDQENFDTLKKLTLDELADNIPYDELNALAKEKVESLEKNDILKVLSSDLILLQDELIGILQMYDRFISVRNALILWKDKKYRKGITRNVRCLEEDKREMVEELVNSVDIDFDF